MSAPDVPEVIPVPTATPRPLRLRHSLADAGGTAMLVFLAAVFIGPTLAWVEWGGAVEHPPGQPVELRMLLWSVLLSLLLPVLQIVTHIRRHGGSAIRGNRDFYPRTAGIAGRIARAHANMGESLLPFAAAVLASHALGVSNRWTVAASVLYLAARASHALTYIAGVTIIRSSAFYAGWLSTATIAIITLRHLL